MKKILILIVAIVCNSCSDFVQDRLDDKTVVIIAPSDHAVSLDPSVTFAWESIPEATAYQIHVASPSFDSAAVMVLDTTIRAADTTFRKTSFVRKLALGQYQWRIRGTSSGSNTPYSYAKFRIIEEPKEELRN